MTREEIENIRRNGVHAISYSERADKVIELCDLALQSLESVRLEALLEKCAVLFETFAEHGMIAYAHGEKSPNAILCEAAAKELRALQSREDVHSTELRK